MSWPNSMNFPPTGRACCLFPSSHWPHIRTEVKHLLAISIHHMLWAKPIHLWWVNFRQLILSTFPLLHKITHNCNPLTPTSTNKFQAKMLYLLQYLCVFQTFNMCKTVLWHLLGIYLLFLCFTDYILRISISPVIFTLDIAWWFSGTHTFHYSTTDSVDFPPEYILKQKAMV